MRTSSATHASKLAHPQPKQIRSRKTEDALLSAAIRVLDRESFGQVTIPLIAAEAKLSPASIYRRFLDKDDLLRAAVARMLGDPATAARRSEQPLAHQSLAGTVDAMIARLLTQHREHPHLLGTITRVLEAEPESAFATEALRHVTEALDHMAEALLEHRESIRHPDPVRAVRFALLSATSAIQFASAGGPWLWKTALPLSDKVFAAELTRQSLAYLRRKP